MRKEMSPSIVYRIKITKQVTSVLVLNSIAIGCNKKLFLLKTYLLKHRINYFLKFFRYNISLSYLVYNYYVAWLILVCKKKISTFRVLYNFCH